MSKSSSPATGLCPIHVPTSQLPSRGLRKRSKTRAVLARHTSGNRYSVKATRKRQAFFLLATETPWRTDSFQSFPVPPPSTEGEFQSIKGDHHWMDIISNAHSPSACVKGSPGLLNLTAVEEALPSRFKYYEEVKIHLGSWWPSPAMFEWKGDSEMLVPFHSDRRYSQFYI